MFFKLYISFCVKKKLLFNLLGCPNATMATNNLSHFSHKNVLFSEYRHIKYCNFIIVLSKYLLN